MTTLSPDDHRRRYLTTRRARVRIWLGVIIIPYFCCLLFLLFLFLCLLVSVSADSLSEFYSVAMEMMMVIPGSWNGEGPNFAKASVLQLRASNEITLMREDQFGRAALMHNNQKRRTKK